MKPTKTHPILAQHRYKTMWQGDKKVPLLKLFTERAFNNLSALSVRNSTPLPHQGYEVVTRYGEKVQTKNIKTPPEANAKIQAKVTTEKDTPSNKAAVGINDEKPGREGGGDGGGQPKKRGRKASTRSIN